VSASRVGTPQHFGWLHGIIKAVLVLNLFDAVFTLVWVHAGLADEANQLMRSLVHDHTVLFVLAKVGLVSIGSLALWNRRDHPAAVIAIFVAFLAYYMVLLYHLQYSSILVRNEWGG